MNLTLSHDNPLQPRAAGSIGDVTHIPDDMHAMLVAWNAGTPQARREALAIADRNRINARKDAANGTR